MQPQMLQLMHSQISSSEVARPAAISATPEQIWPAVQ